MVKTATLVTALLIACFVAGAPRAEVRVAGIYSDMYFHEEAGDVLGTEIWITPAGEGWYAVVQFGDGVPSVPIVVPVTVNGTWITFEISGEHDARRFKGSVTRAALQGTLGGETLTLRRGKSYWQ